MEKNKPTPYEIKFFSIESTTSSGNLKPAPIDINELIKSFGYPREGEPAKNYVVKAEAQYQPERFPGLLIKFEKPKSTATVFYSGKVNILSDDAKKASVKLKRILREHLDKSFKLNYEITNVVGSGLLNQGTDCGVLGAVFPNSRKAFGEGHRVYVEGSKANFVYYPSGKVVGVGFASPEVIRTKLDEQIELINKNLDSLERIRKEVCLTERTAPAIHTYYDIISRAKTEFGVIVTDEDRIMGRHYLERFLEAQSQQKDNLGGGPRAFGAAAAYVMAENSTSLNKGVGASERKPLSQRVIAELTGLVEVTIRNAKKKMEKTIEYA